jgi:hypothetical protein
VEHDLFRKPVSTFRDHAVARLPSLYGLQSLAVQQPMPWRHRLRLSAAVPPLCLGALRRRVCRRTSEVCGTAVGLRALKADCGGATCASSDRQRTAVGALDGGVVSGLGLLAGAEADPDGAAESWRRKSCSVACSLAISLAISS